MMKNKQFSNLRVAVCQKKLPAGFTSGCFKLNGNDFPGTCVHMPPNWRINDPIKIQETCPYYSFCAGENFKKVVND